MVPVISISFGNCKGADYKQAVKGIADSFYNMYEAHRYLLKSTRLEAEDLKEYKSLRELFRAGDTGTMTDIFVALFSITFILFFFLKDSRLFSGIMVLKKRINNPQRQITVIPAFKPSGKR